MSRVANRPVDPDSVWLAIRLWARERQQRFGHKSASMGHLSGYLRLDKAGRAALREGRPPIVKQNTIAAEVLVDSILSFFAAGRNKNRLERVTAMTRLAFGEKAYGRWQREQKWKSESATGAYLRSVEATWSSNHPRGVYVQDVARLAFSVATDGKYLTQRRLLPHEDMDDIVRDLWEELDRVDRRLRLVKTQ